MRATPDTRVMRWLERRSALDMHLSAVTIGELTRGVTRLSESRRRRALTRWIGVDLLQQFEGRILAFDREAAVIWGNLMGTGDREGRPRPAVDAQIAATAIRHHLALATRNPADFAGMPVRTVNPWSDG